MIQNCEEEEEGSRADEGTKPLELEEAAGVAARRCCLLYGSKQLDTAVLSLSQTDTKFFFFSVEPSFHLFFLADPCFDDSFKRRWTKRE